MQLIILYYSPRPGTLATPWNQLTTLVTGPSMYVFWETILTSCPNLESLVFHFSNDLNPDQRCSIDIHMVHLVNLTVVAPELHFVRLFNGIHTPALRTLRLCGDLLFPHPVVGLSSQQHFHDQIRGIRRLSILNSHYEYIDAIASTTFHHAHEVEELDLSSTLKGRMTRRIYLLTLNRYLGLLPNLRILSVELSLNTLDSYFINGVGSIIKEVIDSRGCEVHLYLPFDRYYKQTAPTRNNPGLMVGSGADRHMLSRITFPWTHRLKSEVREGYPGIYY